MKRLAPLLALSLLLLSRSAGADIQKSGPQVWPGKLMVGARVGPGIVFANPFGVQAKFGVDFAGRLKEWDKVSLWLGGELNVGGRFQFVTVEPGVFVMLTLEKLLNIPLVPMVSFGLSGPLYIPYGYNGAYLFGAFQVKFGGGAYYFLTKNIGLGGDMHVAVGPGFLKDAANNLYVGFSGYWDFMLGARFAF